MWDARVKETATTLSALHTAYRVIGVNDIRLGIDLIAYPFSFTYVSDEP